LHALQGVIGPQPWESGAASPNGRVEAVEEFLKKCRKNTKTTRRCDLSNRLKDHAWAAGLASQFIEMQQTGY